MPHSAQISRANPGCILFVIDQSGSMQDRLQTGSKADAVATILNNVLQELVLQCSKEQVYDYFQIGLIGYGHNGPVSALGGNLSSQILHPISQIEANPVRVEDRLRKVPDGAGGVVEVRQKFPVWFDPTANGGTPMVAALSHAGETAADWCDAHMSSFPPVIIHLTDGESTDGNPEEVAETVKEIATDDGQVILMNIHISGTSTREVLLPDTEDGIADPYAGMLFRMSSLLPEGMREVATDLGYEVNERTRAYMFNAKEVSVAHFFKIGTRPSNLR